MSREKFPVDLLKITGGGGFMSQLIAAIATPPGTGGVGILRLSGPGAIEAAAQVF